MKFIEYLEGKKTYLVAIAGIVVIVLRYFDVIDVELTNYLFGLLGLGGIAAFRSAIRKLESE